MADVTGMLQAAAGVGGGNPWEIATARFDGAWNRFSVLLEETEATEIRFKPDGTKMYITGYGGDEVNEYDLLVPWSINPANVTYVQAFSVSAQDATPISLFFKPDGTKMYVLGATNDTVFEYDLSSAWDISTASYLQSFSVLSQETDVRGLFFKPDGTKMYVSGLGSDAINEYDLSSAWDISSASYVQNFSVLSQDGAPNSVFFKSDGLKMYMFGGSNRTVFEYDLSSAWNVSTASYASKAYNINAQNPGLFGGAFKDDGTVLYTIGVNNDVAVSSDLTTPWNVNTASFDLPPATGYLDINSLESNPKGIFFKPDGTKMYVIGSSGDDVNEFDLSTPWQVETATYLQNFSVAGQDTLPESISFKPDGTKMYIVGDSGNDINEYDLSSAWDISSASYLQNFSVSGQDTNPGGIYFKQDGTKMYVVGRSADNVYEYDLSSAWDISTASYLQSFSVASQAQNPVGVFFKIDGTKMYVVNWIGNPFLYQYSLSTPWDISTASLESSFNLLSYSSQFQDLYIKDDGTKMFLPSSGFGFRAVYAFNL